MNGVHCSEHGSASKVIFSIYDRPVDILTKCSDYFMRIVKKRSFVKGKFDLIKLNRDIDNKEQGVDDTLRAELFRFCAATIDNPATVGVNSLYLPRIPGG